MVAKNEVVGVAVDALQQPTYPVILFEEFFMKSSSFRCSRTGLVAVATLAMFTLLPHAAAQTDAYPSRPITLVAPTAPGSTTDLIARLLVPGLSRALGQPVIVENKAGVASAIGATAVAQAKPDGYTLLLAPAPALAVNQWLYKKLSYQPDKDFAPIILVGATPNVLVVHPSVTAKNLPELIALAKAKPGEITYASGGNGTTHHLCGELLRTSAGINITHVPYKSPAPALQDVLAGRVTMMCENLSNALAHVRAGTLRAIALTAKQRHPLAPEISTSLESGLPELDVGVWFGFVAPVGTPPAIIKRLNSEIATALREPGVAQRLDAVGVNLLADSPENFARFITSESTKWRKVVESSGAQID
jgi:tripartite-type tricarboxylate transporter receptor subunit TctC